MIELVFWAGAALFNPQVDSIGMEIIQGKMFVVHRVDEKETLYGIARRYDTTVDAIMEYNPSAKDGVLDIGEILKVPYNKKVNNSASSTQKSGSTAGMIHVVAAGETMYSISRTYGVTVDEIKAWNNLKDGNLSIGQELVIKRKTTTTTQPSSNTITTNQTNTDQSNQGVKASSDNHTVETGETLFSIATKHGITVPQLMQLNNLTSNELRVGQQLRVKVSTAKAQPVVEDHKPEPIKQDQPIVAVEQPVQQQQQTQVPISTPTKVETNHPVITISESRNSDEVVESGMAELIEGTDGNRKYLALHRTAPVGSILKVKNEMNNREVFVRVMGKLPDNAMNDKVIIKISKSAYDRLGAIDPKFRVQLTYYK
jgi:LysM repeat protein